MDSSTSKVDPNCNFLPLMSLSRSERSFQYAIHTIACSTGWRRGDDGLRAHGRDPPAIYHAGSGFRLAAGGRLVGEGWRDLADPEIRRRVRCFGRAPRRSVGSVEIQCPPAAPEGV